MHDALFRRIEGETEELVQPTRDPIGFPTVNPPGEGRGPGPCVRFNGGNHDMVASAKVMASATLALLTGASA